MLIPIISRKKKALPPRAQARRTTSFQASIEHQRGTMAFQKRETWTEADLDALPPGESDDFDRKSGKGYIDNLGAFLDTIAKAASAFLNSGGGSLILGVSEPVPKRVEWSRLA